MCFFFCKQFHNVYVVFHICCFCLWLFVLSSVYCRSFIIDWHWLHDDDDDADADDDDDDDDGDDDDDDGDDDDDDDDDGDDDDDDGDDDDDDDDDVHHGSAKNPLLPSDLCWI